MIVFLRHGQAQNNVERRLVGRLPDIPLTERGREQAGEAAEYLGYMDISRIYSSPMQRTLQTAQIVAEACSLNVEVDGRLNEIDTGRLTGMKYGEIGEFCRQNAPRMPGGAQLPGRDSTPYEIIGEAQEVFLRFYSGDETLRNIGVESFASVQKRALDMAHHVIKRHPGENVLLVTHMDPIKAVLASVLRIPSIMLHEIIIANASLNIFHNHGERLYLGAVNIMGADRFGQKW